MLMAEGWNSGSFHSACTTAKAMTNDAALLLLPPKEASTFGGVAVTAVIGHGSETSDQLDLRI